MSTTSRPSWANLTWKIEYFLGPTDSVKVFKSYEIICEVTGEEYIAESPRRKPNPPPPSQFSCSPPGPVSPCCLSRDYPLNTVTL